MAKKNPPLSSFARSMLEELAGPLAKAEAAPSRKHPMPMLILDPFEEAPAAPGEPKEAPGLQKAILKLMNGGQKDSVERLAFEVDPLQQASAQGIYKQKTRLLPDAILKRLMIQDDLVATVVGTRANQISAFGRPRPDRFSIGFSIEPNDEGIYDRLSDTEAADLRKSIANAEKRLLTCGSTKGWHDKERMTLAQFLYSCTKNAVGLGRIAVEAIWTPSIETGKEEFHSFRPIDAGTIYKIVPRTAMADSVRQDALKLLAQLKGEEFDQSKWEDPEQGGDEYAWVQVIEGTPREVFTSRECLVHNFYPVNDIEMEGYPVTPLDTVISAVTMHINITTHNKLYFQSGRASRGMLVIKSDDVDQEVVGRIRQQFNASINSVQNSWRMPVFGVGSEDDITWQPIDSGSRDMEFQYLSDTNARVILSAFQMSPEELPGYAHLSRGTNSQALSESNQEYLLIAHRDVGIRPLLKQWEDFINASIFPLIDEQLAKLCTVKLVGLDALTAEKESIRLQQDLAIHMTQDEIQHKVEKKPLGKEFGGDYPLAVAWQAVADKFLTVGEQLERFFGREGASKDPMLAYRRDTFFFEWVQLQQQAQQAQAQAQAAAQGGGAGGPPPSGGGGGGGAGPPSGGGGGSSDGSSSSGGDPAASSDDSQAASVASSQQASSELGSALDGAQSALGKSEAHLTDAQRKVHAKSRKTVDAFLAQWAADSKAMAAEIAKAAFEEA